MGDAGEAGLVYELPKNLRVVENNREGKRRVDVYWRSFSKDENTAGKIIAYRFVPVDHAFLHPRY